MNVVDSAGWIEYLRDGAHAGAFARAIEDVGGLLVPAVCLADVYRWALRHLSRPEALRIAVAMQQGRLVDLDCGGWLRAAELGVAHRLGLADSVVLAVARGHGATLWTGDAILAALDEVERKAQVGRGGPPLPTR